MGWWPGGWIGGWLGEVLSYKTKLSSKLELSLYIYTLLGFVGNEHFFKLRAGSF